MGAHLHLVDELTERRADAVAAFLGRYDRSPTSKRTMESALRSIIALFPGHHRDVLTFEWELLEDPLLYDEAQRRVVASVSRSTASKYLSAMRGVLRQMARYGLASPYRVSSTIDGASGLLGARAEPRAAAGRDDVAAMLRAALRDPNNTKGLRDAALVAVLAGTGARRAEVARMTMALLDLDRGEATFRVKGGGVRRVFLQPPTTGYLQDWIERRGGLPGPVFCRVDQRGITQPSASISGHALWKAVARVRDQAAVNPAITPHSFRRHFVTTLLDAGIDVLTVMRLVGHSRPETTARYDRRGDDVLRRAALSIDVPGPLEIIGDLPEEA